MHALDLAQFGHQALLRVQAAGGVGDQHFGAARLRRLQRVEGDRRRVRVLALRDHRHAVALAPGLQLRDRGGAEGVAGGEHQRTAFVLEALGELADGGGLADAVDADGQQHEGLGLACRSAAAARPGAASPSRSPRSAASRARGVGELARLHALAQVFDQLRGGGDADVGGDQRGLDLVEQVVVEARVAREQAAELRAKALPRRRSRQPVLPGRRPGRLRAVRAQSATLGFDVHRRGDDFGRHRLQPAGGRSAAGGCRSRSCIGGSVDRAGAAAGASSGAALGRRASRACRASCGGRN